MKCEACHQKSDDIVHVDDTVLCYDCAEELCADDDQRENERVWDSAGR